MVIYSKFLPHIKGGMGKSSFNWFSSYVALMAVISSLGKVFEIIKFSVLKLHIYIMNWTSQLVITTDKKLFAV